MWRPSPPPPPSRHSPSVFSPLMLPSPPAGKGGRREPDWVIRWWNLRGWSTSLQGNIRLLSRVNPTQPSCFTSVRSSLAWIMKTWGEMASSWSTGWPRPPPHSPLPTVPPAPSPHYNAPQLDSPMPCAGNKRELCCLTSFYINCYIVSSEHIDPMLYYAILCYTMYIYILCVITHSKYMSHVQPPNSYPLTPLDSFGWSTTSINPTNWQILQVGTNLQQT